MQNGTNSLENEHRQYKYILNRYKLLIWKHMNIYTVLSALFFIFYFTRYRHCIRRIPIYFEEVLCYYFFQVRDFNLPVYRSKYNISVSVIIPVFNKGRYLYRSIPSVINQTLKKIETVIVDDCSSDNTTKIAGYFMKKHKNIRYYRIPNNTGTYNCRIVAVKKSHGEYILSLDPDDTLYYITAEKDYDTAISTGSDIVEHQMVRSYPSGKIGKFSWKSPKFSVADSHIMRTEFLLGRLNWNLPRKIVRREVFLQAIDLVGEKYQHMKLTYGEDKLMMGGIYLVARKMVVLYYVGYYYYVDLPDSSKNLYNRQSRNYQVYTVINGRLKEMYNVTVMKNDP
ncbi:hypothetical protein TRFO_43261 [Tritrichomonas foetus]|uniref:Glycosyltransferase 2-like domain-containing protein n=1 Tax=Tritrichomonas foetus TaxID=1144522 RepID=A0A1J4KR48_9EUKA|nr:hypothetical protein TRFO_43261 [Tritrichomonas foetus]|eukprot:OHT13761.1 hypothetical protein TRFO_43261 [Tritrichomonas foetus]